MFTHVVFFKLKEATEDNIKLFKETLLGMDGNIPELKVLEIGVDTLRTDRSFDICLITRFNSEEDYKTYAYCDYHVNIVLKTIRPMIEISKTVDYNN